MKKVKHIQHSDPRPKLRNELRAADQLLDKKQYQPTSITTTTGGGGGGSGQDWIVQGEPCSGQARFGKIADWSSGKPNLSQRLVWDEAGYDAEFEGDPPYIFFTSQQTVRIKCRWTNISADAEDRCFIQFDLSGDDVSLGNYMIIKPTSPFPWPVFWNGGSSPVADGSEFDELDVSGVDIGEWVWILAESTSEYVKFKIWQDGDSEPAGWGAIAQRPPGDTQDITGSRFRDLSNNWSLSGTDGYWVWEFAYFDVSGAGGYDNPSDLFDRTVAEGWGTSSAGIPWTLEIGDASHSEAAIDVNGSSGLGTTNELVWQDNFNRVDPDKFGEPDGGGYWYNDDSTANVDGSSAGEDTDGNFYLYTDGTFLLPYEFPNFPVLYHARILPGTTTTWGVILNGAWPIGFGDGFTPQFFVTIEDVGGPTIVELTFPTTAGNALWEVYYPDFFDEMMDVKVQVNSDSMSVKAWASTDVEPSDWDYTLDSSSPEGGGVGWPAGGLPDLDRFNGLLAGQIFDDARIDFIKVYSVDPCGQEFATPSGVFAVQAFGEGPSGAAQVPGILALCTRITSTTYDLPTDALYVKNVYIDNVPLSGAMWNFNFNSGKRITFLSAVPTGAEVYARYVPA